MRPTLPADWRLAPGKVRGCRQEQAYLRRAVLQSLSLSTNCLAGNNGGTGSAQGTNAVIPPAIPKYWKAPWPGFWDLGDTGQIAHSLSPRLPRELPQNHTVLLQEQRIWPVHPPLCRRAARLLPPGYRVKYFQLILQQ